MMIDNEAAAKQPSKSPKITCNKELITHCAALLTKDSVKGTSMKLNLLELYKELLEQRLLRNKCSFAIDHEMRLNDEIFRIDIAMFGADRGTPCLITHVKPLGFFDALNGTCLMEYCNSMLGKGESDEISESVKDLNRCMVLLNISHAVLTDFREYYIVKLESTINPRLCIAPVFDGRLESETVIKMIYYIAALSLQLLTDTIDNY